MATKKSEKPRYSMEDPVKGTIDWNLSDDLCYLAAMLRELHVDANHGAWRLLREARELYRAGEIEETATLVDEVGQFVGKAEGAHSERVKQTHRARLKKLSRALARERNLIADWDKFKGSQNAFALHHHKKYGLSEGHVKRIIRKHKSRKKA